MQQNNKLRLITYLISTATTLCTLLISPVTFASIPSNISTVAQVTMEVEQDMSTIPAVGYAVATVDQVLGQGVANCDNQYNSSFMSCPSSTMEIDDEIRIGSETKTFTATVILQLIEEDKLSLSDNLAQWLPDFNVPNDTEITIKDLLQMTSSIPDYLNSGTLDGSAGKLVDQWVRELGQTQATPLQLTELTNAVTKRTEGMSYSNTNYMLLGEIAYRISCAQPSGCETIDEQIQTRIIEPLGLGHTLYPTDSDFGPNQSFAESYVLVEEGQSITGTVSLVPSDSKATYNYLTDFTHVNPSVPNAAGAMISNVPDQVNWIRQLASNIDGLLSTQMQFQRLNDTVPGNVAYMPANYGLGIYDFESAFNGSTMIGHSGEIMGYTSSIFYSPDLALYYVIDVTQTPAIKFSTTTNSNTGKTKIAPFEENAVLYLWNLDRQISLAMNTDGNCSDDSVENAEQCTGANVRTTSYYLAPSSQQFSVKATGKTTGGYDYLNCDGPNTTGVVTCPSIINIVPSMAFYGHDLEGFIIDSVDFTLDTNAILEMTGRNSIAIKAVADSNIIINGTILTKGSDSSAIIGSDGDDTVSIAADASINGAINLGSGNNQVMLANGANISAKLYVNEHDLVSLFHNQHPITIRLTDSNDDAQVELYVDHEDGITTAYQSTGETSYSQNGEVIVDSSSLVIEADIDDDGTTDYVAYLDDKNAEMVLYTTHLESVTTNSSGGSLSFWLLGLLPLIGFRQLRK